MMKPRGFTLIELMIAGVVAAILAAMAYPSYRHAVRKTKRAEGRAALMRLMQQEERYYSQFASYLAFSSAADDAEGKRFPWYSADAPRASAYEISGAACEGESIRDCVILTAKPGTGRVDASFRDEECGALTLTSAGVKGAAGDASACWK